MRLIICVTANNHDLVVVGSFSIPILACGQAQHKLHVKYIRAAIVFVSRPVPSPPPSGPLSSAQAGPVPKGPC